MNIHLIRHGKTKGNIEKRYIGTTDEPLTEKSLLSLKEYHVKNIDKVWCSPLIRCQQTANSLFPKHKAIIANDLKEYCFGDFENKNYLELKDSDEYKKWIDGKTSPPGGESHNDFKFRCYLIFKTIVNLALKENAKEIAIVTHGGTVMAIMEHFALPENPFYYWQPPNNGGFILQTDNFLWLKEEKCVFLEKIKCYNV